jgi:Metallopeptidase family M24
MAAAQEVLTYASARSSSLTPAFLPARAKLRSGDLVRFDIGCRVDGYWADMARTAVVGEPMREAVAALRRSAPTIIPPSQPTEFARQDASGIRCMTLCVETPYYQIGWGPTASASGDLFKVAVAQLLRLYAGSGRSPPSAPVRAVPRGRTAQREEQIAFGRQN